MTTQIIKLEGSQEINGCDIEWKARVRISHTPVKLYGPPENCHEEENDWDVEILETYPGGFEERIDEGRVLELAWEKFDFGADAANRAEAEEYRRDLAQDR